MRKELKEFIHEDKIQSANYCLFDLGSSDGYRIEVFLKQLLDIAICKGTDEAIRSFKRSTSETQAPLQRMTLLEGIRIDDEIRVCGGIKLVPLSSDYSELPPYLPMINHTTPTSFVGKTLLIIDASVSPILHKPLPNPDNYPFQVQTRKKNSQKLDIAHFQEKFCHFLSLVCDKPVQPSLAWVDLPLSEFFNLNTSQVLLQAACNAPFRLTITRRVTTNEVKKAFRLYKVMTKLDNAKKSDAAKKSGSAKKSDTAKKITNFNQQMGSVKNTEK